MKLIRGLGLGLVETNLPLTGDPEITWKFPGILRLKVIADCNSEAMDIILVFLLNSCRKHIQRGVQFNTTTYSEV